MINYDKVKRLIDNRFWQHINRETLIPYKGQIPKRAEFLEQLSNSIRNMKYVPSPPRGYVVSHKQNLVVRFIPSLRRQDLCVYFFCIKCLENEIAENRVKGTYGGWKLGGKIRKLEHFDETTSIPDYSYNRFAWKQAWTDYQRKALNLYKRPSYSSYVIFDIANFYDSVRLGRLETQIRESVGKTKTQVVNLLFYFLSNWGKRDLNYERQNIGLPQDEVGDCSRILANFYLQDYDKLISRISITRGSRYLRYADDQIVASRSEKVAREIMFLASKELAKIGLNLNASKARLFNRTEFHKYWSFDIFSLLEDPENVDDIQKAWQIFQQRSLQGVKFKPETVLRRLLSCNLFRLNKNLRSQILAKVGEKEFLIGANEYHLKRILLFTSKERKSHFLKLLCDLSDEVLFNQYHLRLIKFFKESAISEKYHEKVIKNLKALNDLNQ